MKINSHWLARLIGRPKEFLEVTEGGLRVITKRIQQDFEYENVQTLSTESGRLFDSVRLETAAGATKVTWLRPPDAAGAVATATIWRCATAAQEAVRSFEVLLDQNAYLNRRQLETWRSLHWGGCEPLLQISIDAAVLPKNSVPLAVARRYVELATNLDETVRSRNQAFTREESHRYKRFFSQVEKNPLTDRQIEAIVSDEDNTLVVAGAGTGKTSTVVGKVGYLVERGIASEDQVLALAFGRDAAQEMRERVKERTGHDIEIRTFHSLALEIVRQVEQKRPQVAGMAADETSYLRWMAEQLERIMADPEVRDTFLNFAVYHRYPARYWEEFTEAADYLGYIRGHEPRTLRQELVRSFEEQMIADWFTLHGIEYEHEKVYEGAETGNVHRREYRPDFYLPEYDVYLEHFGIDREGRTAPHISASSYQRQIAWKRDLHRRHGTRLLETYSYERMEGRLYASLKEKVTELRGEEPSLLPDEELRVIVGRPEVRETLVKLMTRFLTAFKSNQWTLEDVKAAAGGAAHEERAQAFLALFEIVHQAYERQLAHRREIDFADMINRATEYVESGQYELSFRRVLVDEFQDISRGRRRFLAAILAANEDVRLFCVGDDWQSIYGFTGSDVSIMTRFEEVFGYTRRVDLDRSFRCNREILSASSRFIQQNDNQLRKQIESKRSRGRPAISFAPADATDIADLLKTAVLRGPKEGAKSVLVLGRFSHLEPNGLSQAAKKAGVEAAFMTVHKSKGLEADAVVVLDLAHGRYGFPALLEDDPLLGLVLPETGTFEHAEERRILYVALTRARNTVLLQVPERSPSPFATELMGSEYAKEVDAAGQRRHEANCPQCRGELVRMRKSRTGYAWSCEFQPYCDGGADTCPECREGAFTQEGGRFICRSAVCSHSVKTCPRCGDTPTIIYVTKKGPTRACAKQCGWRERLPHGTGLASPKQTPQDARRSNGQTKGKAKTNDPGPYKWTREAILDALRQYCHEHGDLPTRKQAKKKIDYMPADPRTIISNLDASGWPEAMGIVAQELGFSGSRYYVKR